MAFSDLNSSRVFRWAEFANNETKGYFWPMILFLIYIMIFMGLIKKDPSTANLSAIGFVSVLATYLRWANLIPDFILFMAYLIFAVSAGLMVWGLRN